MKKIRLWFCRTHQKPLKKIYIYVYIVADCYKVNVYLRNAYYLSNLQFLNGNYYQSATQVNGKPSWKKGAYAIWYIQSLNHWMIGPLSYIGYDSGWVCANNDYSGITDNKNKWHYTDGNVWYTPYYTNDIQIACMVNISARDLFCSA